MRPIEIHLEGERGNWTIDTKALLSKGANASVYAAEIDAPPPLENDLATMGLPNDLVLRLLDDPDPQEEDKAVGQFDHFAAAWDKLAGSSVQTRFMEPIFCERRGTPPNVGITGYSGRTSLPRGQMKKGDAIFSLKEGESVWNLSKAAQLPSFTQWRARLFEIIEQVCSNGLHYRDWHSQNVLLKQLPDGSWEINIIDPGALIEIQRVIWTRTPWYKFDKYEIGVSIMGIQDLVWIAVGQVGNDFYDAIKDILTHPNRQLIMPKIIDKR
ncbi:MAG: hypothetical protein ACFFB3_19005 [Candidatus Hodarchaeota archaeon]